MPTSHHRPLGAEVFEDRVLPSGVFLDFRPALSGPPRPPGGEFDSRGPGPDRPGGFWTDGVARFDPRPAPDGFREEIVVLTVPAPLPVAPPAVSPHGASSASGSFAAANETVEEVLRTVVTPSGASVTLPVRFVGVPDPRPFFGPDLVAQPAPQAANPAHAPDLPAVPALPATPGLPANGVPPASAGPVLVAGSGAEPTAEPAVSAVRPALPGSDVVVPESDAAVPIEVDVPAGTPLAGLLGLDTAAVEGQVRQLLDRVSDLAAELPDGLADPDAWSWLATAAVLTGAAGYALWSNRSKPRAGLAAVGPDSVLVRWGEENDAGVR